MARIVDESYNNDSIKDSVSFSLFLLLRYHIRGQIPYSKARTYIPYETVTKMLAIFFSTDIKIFIQFS